MLYHYTTLDTFLRIMEGVTKVNGQYFVQLHASRLDLVNDTTEMCIDAKLIKELVEEYEYSNEIPEELCMSQKIIPNNIEELDECLKAEYDEHIPYGLCFSKEKDFLPMWSLYGDKHYGICLCFSDDIEDNVKKINNQLSVIAGSVAYEKFNESRILKESLDILFYDIIRKKEDRPIDEFIAELYIMTSPFLKDKCYSYENEFRICAHNYMCSNDKTEYYKKDGYVNIHIPLSSLKQIYLGAAMPDILVKILENYFGTEFDFKIEKSKTPFRLK